ncbi:acyltransferase [bacterium]|nr:acyltransferase [bacterium]
MRQPATRPTAAAVTADWSGRFRPDIEGLRGLAVVPVVLYHAAVPGFAGGYVGVDVFFVLSGYLITGLLLREAAATGAVALAAFYARRARRILPAAALVLVATLLASALCLPPVRVPDIAVDGGWAALFSANLRFALQATDYLQADRAPSPLLHYWSLGVEEQFYLLWPALVLLVVRRRGNGAARAGALAFAVAGASFALSLRLTATNLPWAFFSLPTRAWELALGALLAVADARRVALPRGLAALAGWSGAALVGIAVGSLSAATPFPGTAALLPTVGTALLIAAGGQAPPAAPSRLLATPVPRFIGRISYSLYLWSWPLLVIPAGAADAPLPLWQRLALAALAVPLAAASQQLVEQPLRRGRGIGTVPARNLAYAAALSVAVVAVALATYGGARWRLGGRGVDSAAAPPAALVPLLSGPLPDDVHPSLAEVAADIARLYPDKCHLGARETEGAACAYGAPASSRTVVLFGDSHAANWFPALEPIAAARGWRLLARTKSACTAADVPVWNWSLKRVYAECATWREGVLRAIEAAPPALVVLAAVRTAAVVADGRVIDGPQRERAWADGLARTIRRIAATGAAVVMILDTPRPAGDLPTCLSKHADDVAACATARSQAVDEHWRALERATATDAGASVIDPTDWVCPGDPCPPVISSRIVFRDDHHLSTAFVTLLASRLANALPADGSIAAGGRAAAP